MQIAVVSTDGLHVDNHFGKAERFLIYEVDQHQHTLLDCRDISSLSIGDREHGFDQQRFDAVFGALDGCRRIYCTKIGDRPKKELAQRGIEVVVYHGPIQDITL